MTHSHKCALLLVFGMFLALRLPALDQIYHQDEAKWACYVDPVVQANYPEECRPGTIPHPPLGEWLFSIGGRIAGYDHLRVVPLFFAILNFWLLFAIARRRWGPRAAIAACFLTSVTFYSVLASVQIDTDGAILPFWALLAWWAYDRGMAACGRVPTSKLQETTANLMSTRTVRNPEKSDDRSVPAPTRAGRHDGRASWVLFAVACAGGMVTKVSFVLALAAFGLDALCALGWRGLWERRMRLLGLGAGIAVATVVFFSLVQFVLYPYGEPLRFIWYADKFPFLNFASRPWGDIVFQVLKALCYFGPLMPCLAVLALVAARRAQTEVCATIADQPSADVGQTSVCPARGASGFRLPLFFLGVHAAFYLVLFDFSGRPLERYLEFSIAPMAMVAAVFLSRGWGSESRGFSLSVLLGIIACVCLGAWLYHGKSPDPVPLYPKSILLSRLAVRDFGFLIPFTGGSGPLGFYISAKFLIAVWMAAGAWVAIGMVQGRAAGWWIPFMLVAAGGLASGGMIEEYLLGIHYGQMSHQARPHIERIRGYPPEIPVVTYNDIGCYELRRKGVYAGRFYARPDYWESNRKRLDAFRGAIFTFEFPLIDPHGPYRGFVFQKNAQNLSETLAASLWRTPPRDGGYGFGN